MKVKPRAKFCWQCGNQLYQRNIHTEMVVDGHSRILHKACAETISKDRLRPALEEDHEKTRAQVDWGK